MKKRQFHVLVNDEGAFISDTLENIARMINEGWFRRLKIGDKVTIEVEKFNPKHHEGPEWEGIQ